MQHHLIVVAKNRHKIAAVTKLNQLVKDASRINATVNEIAQGYDCVIRLRIDGFNQSCKCNRTAVDVADCQNSFVILHVGSTQSWLGCDEQ